MGPVKNLNTQLPVGLANDALADNAALSFEGALDEFNIYDFVFFCRCINFHYIIRVNCLYSCFNAFFKN